MVEVKEKTIGQVEKVISCQIGWQRGQCKNGHKFVKVLLCGVEWCETCGAKGSWLHKRRMSYWWDKVMSMKSIGYLIITIPQEHWQDLKSKKVLQEIRRYWIRKLKRLGVERGLSRWHFSSEQKEYKEWYPHLNLLFDAGRYLDVNQFRDDFVCWLKNNFGYKGNVVNIYYQYYSRWSKNKDFYLNGPKKVHLLKYITRSTMRWFDENLARDVYYNFRNMVVWCKGVYVEEEENGVLEKKLKKIWAIDQKEIERSINDLSTEDLAIAEEIGNISKLRQGICCKCGADIIWVGYSRIVGFNEDSEDLGGGYFYVGCDPPKGCPEWINEWIDKQKREIKYSRKKRDFYSWYDDNKITDKELAQLKNE